MTTILRVKRLRGDDPVEALVLSCKKKKTEDEDSGASQDLLKKVFNFTATVDDKDDKIATSTVHSFHKGPKHSDREKSHTPDIRVKQRREQRERSEESRFTLLSCLRFGKATEDKEKSDAAGDPKEEVTIVDVSKESDKKLKKKTDIYYVYDLYSIDESDNDSNDFNMEDVLSIRPCTPPLYYLRETDYHEEEDPDEDDSNDENNWRNDYPDDSSMDEDENDDVLARQLKGFHLDEYDLSGDSGEEAYLCYDDEDLYHYYEAEDLYGTKYARYKANALKSMMQESERSEDDGESSDDHNDSEMISHEGESD